MIRGTTPTHTFTIPFDGSAISKVKIIYAQDDKTLFEKLNDGCLISENTITTTLTQEETLMFDHKKPVQIQLRILTTGGNALASVIHRIGVSQLLDEEVVK